MGVLRNNTDFVVSGVIMSHKLKQGVTMVTL